MSLHYLLKVIILISQCDTTELSKEVTPTFIPPQLWPPNSPDWCVGILPEKVTKHASVIWSYQRRHGTNDATMTT